MLGTSLLKLKKQENLQSLIEQHLFPSFEIIQVLWVLFFL